MTLDIFDRTKEAGELVFPGTCLAVTEEFIGGYGTYTEGNNIYAAVAGKVSINIEKHEISVMSKPTAAVIPKKGDIVIGGVVNASRQMITVSIHYVKNKEAYPTYTMVIHVSQLSREYLDTVDEAVCLADIVRAKVIDDKTIPLQGTLIDSQLGVILASCSRCGSQLEKIGRNKLKCKECAYFEKRKTTIDYGSGKLAFKT